MWVEWWTSVIDPVVLGATALIIGVYNTWNGVRGRQHQQWTRWSYARAVEMDALRMEHGRVIGQLLEAEKSIGVLEEKMNIFWKGVAFNAAMTLHSPHTPEFDHLLDKLSDETITPREVLLLKDHFVVMLATVMDPDLNYWHTKMVRDALLALMVIYHPYAVRTMSDLYQLYRVPTHASQLSQPAHLPHG